MRITPKGTFKSYEGPYKLEVISFKKHLRRLSNIYQQIVDKVQVWKGPDLELHLEYLWFGEKGLFINEHGHLEVHLYAEELKS